MKIQQEQDESEEIKESSQEQIDSNLLEQAKIPGRDVKSIRLNREIKILDFKQNQSIFKYQHFPEKKCIVINKIIKIEYGENFPFEKPQIDFALEGDSKYVDSLCLFDLNKLYFRDIMKEDFHPSLNLSEVAERSLEFLDKTVILYKNQYSNSVVSIIMKLLNKFDKSQDGLQWHVILFVFVINLLIVIGFSYYRSFFDEPDSGTKEAHQLIDKIKYHHGINMDQIDPFADNLAVFIFFKTLALISCAFEQIYNPRTTKILFYVLELKGFYFHYAVSLRILSVIMQFFLIYIPVSFIIENIYKKNSNLFKSLLLGICLTGCSIYSQIILKLDFQGLLFVGFTLWSQAFILSDQITASIVCYGISLNCSLDGLLYLQFFIYRIICKSLKQISIQDSIIKKKSKQRNDAKFDENIDFGMFQNVILGMNQILISFLIGFLLPWFPYLYITSGKVLFQRVNLTLQKLLYDHLKTSIYHQDLLNPHSFWTIFFQHKQQFLKNLAYPIIIQLGWNFLLNVLFIIITRENKKLTSHKKSLLQLIIVILSNFMFGIPKMQSFSGVLALLSILFLILHQEYQIFAIVFSASILVYDINKYFDNGAAFIFVFIFFVHFLGFNVILKEFLCICYQQQIQQSKNTEQIDEEEINSMSLKAKNQRFVNEAFRVNYNLIKQMDLRGKYGFSKKLIYYQDAVFIFTIAEVTIIFILHSLNINSVYIDTYQRVQIFLKMIILLIITFESLMSHQYGPQRSTEKIKKGFKKTSGPFINRFNEMIRSNQCGEDCGHNHNTQDSTVGFDNKQKTK